MSVFLFFHESSSSINQRIQYVKSNIKSLCTWFSMSNKEQGNLLGKKRKKYSEEF